MSSLAEACTNPQPWCIGTLSHWPGQGSCFIYFKQESGMSSPNMRAAPLPSGGGTRARSLRTRRGPGRSPHRVRPQVRRTAGQGHGTRARGEWVRTAMAGRHAHSGFYMKIGLTAPSTDTLIRQPPRGAGKQGQEVSAAVTSRAAGRGLRWPGRRYALCARNATYWPRASKWSAGRLCAVHSGSPTNSRMAFT